MDSSREALGFRQALGAIYVALAAASGEKVLDRANGILTDAVNTGTIADPYARRAIMSLVRNSSLEPAS
jgi:hypothetical protein